MSQNKSDTLKIRRTFKAESRAGFRREMPFCLKLFNIIFNRMYIGAGVLVDGVVRAVLICFALFGLLGPDGNLIKGLFLSEARWTLFLVRFYFSFFFYKTHFSRDILNESLKTGR